MSLFFDEKQKSSHACNALILIIASNYTLHM